MKWVLRVWAAPVVLVAVALGWPMLLAWWWETKCGATASKTDRACVGMGAGGTMLAWVMVLSFILHALILRGAGL